MKFQLLIKTEIPKNEEFSCLKYLRCSIYHAKTIVGILTFMSRINFVLKLVEYEKFITSGPGNS